MSTTTLSLTVPERSHQQRLQALQRGNEIRQRRARLKRDLKAGRCSAITLLADPPDWLRSMKVIDVLLAVPTWGRVKAGKALKAGQISPSKTVAGLSPRQCAALIRALGSVPCE